MARSKKAKAVADDPTSPPKETLVDKLLPLATVEPGAEVNKSELIGKVQHLLSIGETQAKSLILGAETLYIEKMRKRFSKLDISKRLKRTNPFLLMIRGAKTVKDWHSFRFRASSSLRKRRPSGTCSN